MPSFTVRRFVLSDTEDESITILQHLDYFKRIFSKLPQVRWFAEKLIPGVVNNDLETQIGSVFQFVKDAIKYVADPSGTEYVTSPVTMLEQIYARGVVFGDCDDHVLLLVTLLESLGIPTQIVGVKLNGDVYDHVVARVKFQGQWWDLDPCAKNVPQREFNDVLVIG